MLDAGLNRNVQHMNAEPKAQKKKKKRKKLKWGAGRRATGTKNGVPACTQTGHGKQLMRNNGLPQPQAIKYGSPEFIKLQNEWYKRAVTEPNKAGETFKDLEWLDKGTGKGQNSDYLKGSDLKGHVWREDLALYHRLLSNYISNYRFKVYADYWLLKQIADGRTYRDIHPDWLKRYYTPYKSLFYFYTVIDGLKQHMITWNKKSKHGLLNPKNADVYMNDAPLSGFLFGGGLDLDHGWMQENVDPNWRDDSH